MVWEEWEELMEKRWQWGMSEYSNEKATRRYIWKIRKKLQLSGVSRLLDRWIVLDGLWRGGTESYCFFVGCGDLTVRWKSNKKEEKLKGNNRRKRRRKKKKESESIYEIPLYEAPKRRRFQFCIDCDVSWTMRLWRLSLILWYPFLCLWDRMCQQERRHRCCQSQ